VIPEFASFEDRLKRECLDATMISTAN